MFSFLVFIFKFLGHTSRPVGFQFPHKGSNLCPWHWKFRVLTTGPPREVSFFHFFSLIAFWYQTQMVIPLCSHFTISPWSTHCNAAPEHSLYLSSCQDSSKRSWFQAYLSSFIHYLLNLVILLSSSFPLKPLLPEKRPDVSRPYSLVDNNLLKPLSEY